MFTDEQILSIPELTGLKNALVTLIKEYNHVFRIESDTLTAYLKTYTKSWYGDDIEATGGCVDHEAAAWQHLASAGLSVPVVIRAETTCDNAVGRPYILTRALDGTPFTDLLANADPQQFRQIISAVGRYMRTMHNIRFAFPGYISTAGLTAPPDPDGWQHGIWTFAQFERDLVETWRQDRASVFPAIMEQIEDFYRRHRDELKAEYADVRYVHGDCHAHQFFVRKDKTGWQVTGVVDMEVSSAGDYGWDLVKFGIEMGARFPISTRWWEAFFEGYGQDVSFDLIKLRMLTAHHVNYSWILPLSRAQLLTHLLRAKSWDELYDFPS